MFGSPFLWRFSRGVQLSKTVDNYLYHALLALKQSNKSNEEESFQKSSEEEKVLSLFTAIDYKVVELNKGYRLERTMELWNCPGKAYPKEIILV